MNRYSMSLKIFRILIPLKDQAMLNIISARVANIKQGMEIASPFRLHLIQATLNGLTRSSKELLEPNRQDWQITKTIKKQCLFLFTGMRHLQDRVFVPKLSISPSSAAIGREIGRASCRERV